MLKHIGFIMDGNRRWAKKLSNVVSFGHASWGDNIENILTLCLDAQMEYVSMWALSKENILERSEVEIAGIFQLFRDKIPKLVTKLIKNSIRLDIIGGIRRAMAEWIDPISLNEKTFLTYLDSGKYPSPDLIVRTGWSIRHSWFYLYHSAYSEYFFSDTLWPDFWKVDFDKAIKSYNSTNRNFWK